MDLPTQFCSRCFTLVLLAVVVGYPDVGPGALRWPEQESLSIAYFTKVSSDEGACSELAELGLSRYLIRVLPERRLELQNRCKQPTLLSQEYSGVRSHEGC